MLPATFNEASQSDGIPGLELYWIAYWELRSTTAPDFPIPWSECEGWGQAHGLDYDQRERMHELLGAMDAAYRKWHGQRQERAEQQDGKRFKRRGNRT